METSTIESTEKGALLENARYFANQNSEAIAKQENPLLALGPWLHLVKMLRDTEMEKDIGGSSSPELRSAHKHFLSLVTWQGEELMALFRGRDSLSKTGLSLADIEAILQDLYETQRVLYGGMTQERREQVLNEVFGAT